jgi:DNA-binding CsgD family transcriptional regulator
VTDVLCPVLIGRGAELAALRAALDGALRGDGRLACLTGEPGIGKSRLARELAGRARDRGVLVLTGRAVPAGGSTPYRPLTEALLQAQRHRAWPADEEAVRWQPALDLIVPRPSDGARPGAARPGRARAGLNQVPAAVRGEAVLRLLGRLAVPAGLLVVLEDLHWADPDTLAVLEYLADNLAGQPVLVLVTCRDEPLTAAMELIRRLHARRAASHLILGRLDDEGVASMVRACWPQASPDQVTRVQRTADGVPFLVEEVLAAPGVPASFRDLVRARLADLGAADRAVLETAAVLGRHFDWRLLAPATGRSAATVAGALQHGVDRLLLVVDGTEFRFRHALTREAVAAAILPPARAALAAAALAALERASPGLSGAAGDVAADLAIQAGDPRRAGRLLTASGRAALDRGALATAADTLRRAAALLGGSAGPGTGPGTGPEASERDTAEALRVQALALAGQADEAMASGEQLIARLAGHPAIQAQLYLHLAHAAVTATRWAAASRYLDAAAACLGTVTDAEVGATLGAAASASPGPDPAGLAAVLRAEVALARGELTAARRLAEAALATPGSGPELRCHALEIVGRSERLHDLAAAQRAFEQALATAEQAGLPFWRLRALHELGTVELFEGAGTGRLSQARQMADELGALAAAATLDLQLAAAADSRFQLDELARHAASSLAISVRLGLAATRAKALLFLTESRALRGDRAGTEDYAAQALAAADGELVAEAFVWGAGRAMCALLNDDETAAVAAFERSAALLARCPNAEPANFRGVRLVVLAGTGDPRAAAEIGAARRAGITTFFANRGLAGYAEAILAGRAGQDDRAASLAAAAGRALDGYPVWGDLGRLYAAEAALAGGWGEPAGWLRAARRSFAAHGLPRLAQRCARGLAAAATAGAAGVPAGDGLPVTPRERDVLELIAAGLRNKEIAARLYLSPRTVEKHVESLLRKTGARTRTQLAGYAGRDGRDGGDSRAGGTT